MSSSLSTNGHLVDLARDPATPGERLRELAGHESLAVRLAVAENPAAPREALNRLLLRSPSVGIGEDATEAAGAALMAAVLSNPAVEFCLLEDPTWLLRQHFDTQWAIARSPALTPLAWNALSGCQHEHTKALLLRSPVAPPEAWRALGFASEFDALLAALKSGGDPAERAACAAALAAHPEMESRLETRSSWLSDHVALDLAPSSGQCPALWNTLRRHHWKQVRLSLARPPMTPLGAWKLLGFPTAGDCYLSHEFLTSFEIETLLNYPSRDAFTSLNLTGNKLGNELLGALARGPVFARILSLDLTDNALDAEGAKALAQSASFPALTTLHLGNNPLGDAGIAALASSASFPLLATLTLWGTQIGTDGIAAFGQSAAFPLLEALDLSSNELEMVGAPGSLADFPRLASLHLSCNKLGPASMAQMAEEPAFSRLTALDLSGNPLGDAGLAALAEGETFSRLTHLGLARSQLREGSALTLARSTVFSRLTSLDLSDNEIGEEGVEALAQSPTLAHLSSLKLDGNQAKLRGVVALAKATTLTHLTELHLSSNQLGDAGLVALAQSSAFPSLRELRLADNQVGEEGIRALIQASFFPFLTRLQLGSQLEFYSRKLLTQAAHGLPYLEIW